jgi:hypothetical protein
MSAEAIFLVPLARRTRLYEALIAAGDPGAGFVGPLDDPDAQGASLILFLYRIRSSPTLRNRKHRVLADNPPPPFIVFNNSLPLDLYYLVTVGTRAGTSDEPLLRTLGFAMRERNTNPDLVGAAVGQESVHVSLEPLTTEEASRIWSFFPTVNYRTSIAYLGPVWIDPAQSPAQGARVVQDKLPGGHKAMEAEGV